MIEPNLISVCNNNYVTLKMNKYSKFYDNKIHTLDIVVKFDEQILEKVKFVPNYEPDECKIEKIDINTIHVKINYENIKRNDKIAVISFKYIDYHSNKAPFYQCTCNDLPFVILKNYQYPPLLHQYGYFNTIKYNNEPSIQAFIVNTTKDSVTIKISASKNILINEVQQFSLIVLKGDNYKVVSEDFKFTDYTYTISGLNESTEYKMKVKMKYDDAWYDFVFKTPFITKHSTLGNAVIQVKNIKECSCDVVLTKFEAYNNQYTNGVKVDLLRVKDNVIVANHVFNNVSIDTNLPLMKRIDGLNMDTIYKFNYKVFDINTNDERVVYDTKKFTTNKPIVDINMTRVDDQFVDIMLNGVTNITKKYSVILKIDDTKIRFDEYPVTKTIEIMNDKTSIIGDVFLTDNVNNSIIDHQKIFYIN